MLLAVVPAGFLVLAVLAAFGPAQSTQAAVMFAGIAAVVFVVGAVRVVRWRALTYSARPAAPGVEAVRRFLRDWVRDHPGASEAEARAALAQRFSGSTAVPEVGAAIEATPPHSAPWDRIVEGALVAYAASIYLRLFPIAPAEPADIEMVLAELRAENAFGPG
jgi:hypothetical protein